MKQRDPEIVNTPGRFLTAEWRNVAMLNYEVDPSLVRPFVPAGTELDFWNAKTYVSLVGFRFLGTRVFGIPIPFHGDFDEANLRFYVVRLEGREVKRGVVFIREIVPRWAVAKIARTVYNENYVALAMSHRINHCESGVEAEYAWRSRGKWSKIRLATSGAAILPAEGSQEQFIAEHYWGYTAQRNGGCLEYRVEHPPWRVWPSHDAKFEGEMEELYGRDLAAVVTRQPSSAFLAEGSPVTVYRGRRLPLNE
jgi:uncharacterized protein YqjF (DUF2071 family)